MNRKATTPVVLLAGLAVALGVAGCGGDSKPAYCADRAKLDSSVKDLPNALKTGGTGGLQAQLKTIQTDATAAISSAESDFPTETSAVKTNVEQLKTAVAGLPSSPSAAQVAAVAVNASAVVNAVKAYTNATKSTCQ